ncbi:hypothetical protein EYF80_036510 [Liparis tanakae]|uniref:Uncharacterized protein n=1 Tax=Liparis tanakae TaxID=230148 RepID=A0A4Z2GIH4_9TELE|nr:hypothetical protein EYF80_036510 [Liparis tanakae]
MPSADVSTKNRLRLNGPGDSRFGVSAYPPAGQSVHTLTPLKRREQQEEEEATEKRTGLVGGLLLLGLDPHMSDRSAKDFSTELRSDKAWSFSMMSCWMLVVVLAYSEFLDTPPSTGEDTSLCCFQEPAERRERKGNITSYKAD